MSIQLVASCVEKIGSREFLQEWDNIGVLIDANTPENVNKQIILCIDFTMDVLNECIHKNIKYVISYHPCIFKPLKNIKNKLYVYTIQNCISVYSPHTLLDNFMNAYISNLIGANPGTLDDIITKIKKIANLDCVRAVRSRQSCLYNNNGDILVGVGATFRNVTQKDCLLVTGEMSHHDLLMCKNNRVDVIMLEHSNSERITLPEIKRLLESDIQLKEYQIQISERDKDPVEFV